MVTFPTKEITPRQYQIILLGDRGTPALVACTRLLHNGAQPGLEQTTCESSDHFSINAIKWYSSRDCLSVCYGKCVARFPSLTFDYNLPEKSIAVMLLHFLTKWLVARLELDQVTSLFDGYTIIRTVHLLLKHLTRKTLYILHYMYTIPLV